MAALQGRYATALPSVLGMAASWDPDAAFLYGSVIGRELRAMGFNMSIGGGMDLIREPRNGRNFEYASEDPILAGTMVGQLARGVQSNHIMGDIKHYALNDQETGRNTLNAIIDPRAMRETDLLAFQIAIGLANPAGVMCSYNRINGDYACENDYTLNQVLKHDWGFKGFVLSDWGGTHSTVKAALAGLDYGPARRRQLLLRAAEAGRARRHTFRRRASTTWSTASCAACSPPASSTTRPCRAASSIPSAAATTPRRSKKNAVVLLKNTGGILPLSAAKTRSIAVIGGHADVGVLSGGGSAQVDSPGGNAVDPKMGASVWGKAVYFPSSPLRYIREQAAPDTAITYDPGTDNAAAAKAAASAQLAIVFVTQWMSEGQDSATLSLPDNQDALVAAVAAANPNTIVVLENGGPVSMPWAPTSRPSSNPGIPASAAARPSPTSSSAASTPPASCPSPSPPPTPTCPIPRSPASPSAPATMAPTPAAARNQARNFTVDYNVEGMAVGYRWFQEKNKQPLFPFGFGLSYTHFAYSNLKVDASRKIRHLRPAQHRRAGRRRDRPGLRHPPRLRRRALPQTRRMEARLARRRRHARPSRSPSTRSTSPSIPPTDDTWSAPPATSSSKSEAPPQTCRCTNRSRLTALELYEPPAV